MAKRVFVATPHQAESGYALSAIHDGLALASAKLKFEIEITGGEQRRISGRESLAMLKDQLKDQVSAVDLMIADLSGRNSNVLFEMGYAQALQKPLILLAQDSGDVPFDLRDQILLLYQPSVLHTSLVFRIVEAVVDVFIKQEKIGQKEEERIVQKRHKLFISYSHADRHFLDRILVHLRPLERQKLIEYWSDTNIKPGDRWKQEIRKALDEARIAVLLISADFLASEFIVTNELPPLLAAAEKEGTQIIPLIVKPSRFVRDDSLSRFQALNDPKESLIKMGEADREETYSRLAEIIELDLRSSFKR